MDIETAKNYLALYDETYSYIQLSNITGYSVSELRIMYDEIVEAKEIQKRRRAMRRMVVNDGVFRIDPVTFDATKYNELSTLKNEGYNVSNIFYSCRNPSSICNGYLWRFGVDVDERDIKESVIETCPEMFVPVYWWDKKENKTGEFETIMQANSLGYNKKCIMEVLQGKKKLYKGKVWSNKPYGR